MKESGLLMLFLNKEHFQRYLASGTANAEFLSPANVVQPLDSVLLGAGKVLEIRTVDVSTMPLAASAGVRGGVGGSHGKSTAHSGGSAGSRSSLGAIGGAGSLAFGGSSAGGDARGAESPSRYGLEIVVNSQGTRGNVVLASTKGPTAAAYANQWIEALGSCIDFSAVARLRYDAAVVARRKEQLEEFFDQMHLPRESRLDVDLLFEETSYPDIVAVLLREYGRVPDGWQRVDDSTTGGPESDDDGGDDDDAVNKDVECTDVDVDTEGLLRVLPNWMTLVTGMAAPVKRSLFLLSPSDKASVGRTEIVVPFPCRRFPLRRKSTTKTLRWPPRASLSCCGCCSTLRN